MLKKLLHNIYNNTFLNVRNHYRSRRKQYYLQFNGSAAIHSYVSSVKEGIESITGSKFLRKSCAVYSIDGNGDVILEYADKHNTVVKKAIRKYIKEHRHD